MDFAHLLPDQFENLTFDLLQAAGLKSLVWRTPGADGGRDIEGTYTAVDFSNYYHHQKWYVECKRYTSSIDWPTVWNKIAYADSRKADFLLLVTNSNPSPACETEISLWNAGNNRLLVRVWRGYELQNILLNYPQVAAKYGLLGTSTNAELSLQALMFEAMKLAQSSYVSHELGVSALASLEANAALAELVSARHSQLRAYGRIITTVTNSAVPHYDWLTWNGSADGWDEVGTRALLSMTKYLTGSDSIEAISHKEQLTLKLEGARFEITGTSEKTFAEVAIWADVEIGKISKYSVTLLRRN
jgi:hypothetical protein